MRTGLTFKCKFSIKWATPLFDKMSSLVAAKIDENNHDLAVSEQRMTSDDSCAGSNGNEDNNESKKRIKIIEDVYRPALRLMMLSGSYFGYTSFDKFHDTSSQPQKQCQLSRFCCLTVACCLWINFFMSVISIFYDGRDIYLLIMFASWTLMVSLMGTTCLIVLPLTSSRRSRFQHFLLKLVTVHFEPEILRGIVSKAKLYANVFSIVVIFAIGAEIISDIFLDINIGTYEPWKRLRILRIIIQFFCSYGIAVWFTFPFFCTTCNLLEALFDDFNKRVSSLPLNSNVSVTALREQHRHLSQVVQIADNMISPLLCEAVGFFIPVICFTFYQITHADLSKQKITAIGHIGVNSFWLLSSSGILLMVMTFGARLNEKVGNSILYMIYLVRNCCFRSTFYWYYIT